MKKAGDILTSILGSPEAKQAENWSTFFRGWRAIVGDDIAAHTEVKDVKRGAVLVEVDHPGWFQMLQLKKTTALKKIKEHYPELEIRDIRCFLRSNTGGDSPPVEIKERPPVPEADKNSEEYLEFKALLDRLREKGFE